MAAVWKYVYMYWKYSFYWKKNRYIRINFNVFFLKAMAFSFLSYWVSKQFFLYWEYCVELYPRIHFEFCHATDFSLVSDLISDIFSCYSPNFVFFFYGELCCWFNGEHKNHWEKYYDKNNYKDTCLNNLRNNANDSSQYFKLTYTMGYWKLVKYLQIPCNIYYDWIIRVYLNRHLIQV